MRDRHYLLWVALATFFLVLLNLPSSVSSSLRGFFRESMASYQGAVTRTLSRFQQGRARGGNPEEVARDRDRLDREVAALRLRVRELELASRENTELRNQLGYRARLAAKTVACEVIARDDGSGWWQTLRLDKGREDGILEGMPVITPEGVVGRTIEVSSQTCDVLLISDRSFKTSVRFEQDGSYGILHGGGVTLSGSHGVGILCLPSLYRVDYVRKDLEIKTGELVMTSGLGGVFPAGLVVGRVVRMRPDESGLFQQAEIAPAADLARLQRVLVIVSGDGR